MALGVLQAGELEWEAFEAGSRFGAEWADLARRLGARKLGYGAWRLPPGKASVPYHFHLVNEELAVVLEGEPSVRLDGGELRLGPGDVVAMAPGEASAHQFLNRSDRSARLILFSTMAPRDWIGYPDSGKEMVVVAGLAREPAHGRLIFRGDRILRGEESGPHFEGEPVDEPLGDPDPAPEGHERRVVRTTEMAWEPVSAGASRKAIGSAAGCRALGCTAYRVAPGQASAPFHFHHVNEEAFVVLDGQGTLRTEAGEVEVGPEDVIGGPVGPGSAHRLEAAGEAPLVVLAVSTMEEPDVVEYPDTGEVRVFAGSPPGGDVHARTIDLLARREAGRAGGVER